MSQPTENQIALAQRIHALAKQLADAMGDAAAAGLDSEVRFVRSAIQARPMGGSAIPLRGRPTPVVSVEIPAQPI